MDCAPRQEGARHLVGIGSGEGRRGQGTTVAVAGDCDHQGTAVGVRLMMCSREPPGPPRQSSPHLRRPQQGRLEHGGDLYRTRPPPEPAHPHLDALQLREDLRQAEMLRARDGHGRASHTGVAEGEDTLGGPLVDQSGRGSRAWRAVGEPVLGRRGDQRLARATRGQVPGVAQGAPVMQLTSAPRTGDEVADLDMACALARLFQGQGAGEIAGHVVVAERGHESRSPGGRDGVQLKEDPAGEGALPRGVEVARSRPRGSRDRGHAQLHERPDCGDDHIAGAQKAREVGGRGEVHFCHRQFRLEAVGQGQHLRSASPDQGRLLTSSEQFPENSPPRVPRRAQQQDSALFHGYVCLPEGTVTTTTDRPRVIH